MVAINVLPRQFSLEDWKDFWWSVDGGDDMVVAEDIDMRAVSALKVRGLGTTIIINRNGQVVYRDSGATPYKTLRSEVDKAR